MFFVDFVFALVFALLFTFILVAVFGRRGPGPYSGFVFFLVLLFFAIWAGGVWLVPVGPPLWGRSWLTFLLVGLFLALIIAASLPPARRTRAQAGEKAADVALDSREEKIELALGTFFWVLLVVCLVIVATRYLAPPF